MADKTSVVELMVKLRDALSGPAKNATAQVSKFGAALDKFEQKTRHFKSIFYAGAAMEGMAFGIGEALKSLAEPAIEFQQAQQNLKRATHLSTEQLAAFERQATALSDKFPRTAEHITQAQATLVRTLGSASAAMQTVGIATRFATATTLDMNSATNLLATAYENVGDKSVPLKVGFAKLADQLTVLQNKFSTSSENGEMMVRSFARLSGAAKVAGVGSTQLMAALGVLNKSGFAGGRGASDYLEQAVERLGQIGKNGIPAITKWGIMLAGHLGAHGHFHMNLLGTLANMQRANPARLQAYLKSLGQVGGTLQILLDRYDQVRSAMTLLDHAQGASGKMAKDEAKDWHNQLKTLHNTYQNLERSLGSVLVPLLVSVGHTLEPILERFAKFAKAHTALMKVAFVVALVATGLLALGGFLAIAIASFGALAATAEFAATVFEGFEGVMVTLDAIADANPLGLIAFAAAALAVVAYDVYERWSTVKSFFETLGGYLAKPFVWLWGKLEGYLKAAYTWGRDFVHAIVKGFESAFGFLDHGLHKVASKISKYLPFFHPGKGPGTHHRSSVVQNIVHSMRSAPMIAATAGMSLMAAPVLAAASGGMPAVEIHLHMEGAAGQPATEDDEAFADRIVDTLATHKQRIAGQVAEIMDAAHGRWQSTGF
jgi:TP901 family phage tail tape measure protein